MARSVEDRWQHLRTGDVIPDQGGSHETFEVAEIRRPSMPVYRARRGSMDVTWSLTLEPVPGAEPAATRILLRLRLGSGLPD